MNNIKRESGTTSRSTSSSNTNSASASSARYLYADEEKKEECDSRIDRLEVLIERQSVDLQLCQLELRNAKEDFSIAQQECSKLQRQINRMAVAAAEQEQTVQRNEASNHAHASKQEQLVETLQDELNAVKEDAQELQSALVALQTEHGQHKRESCNAVQALQQATKANFLAVSRDNRNLLGSQRAELMDELASLEKSLHSKITTKIKEQQLAQHQHAMQLLASTENQLEQHASQLLRCVQGMQALERKLLDMPEMLTEHDAKIIMEGKLQAQWAQVQQHCAASSSALRRQLDESWTTKVGQAKEALQLQLDDCHARFHEMEGQQAQREQENDAEDDDNETLLWQKIEFALLAHAKRADHKVHELVQVQQAQHTRLDYVVQLLEEQQQQQQRSTSRSIGPPAATRQLQDMMQSSTIQLEALERELRQSSGGGAAASAASVVPDVAGSRSRSPHHTRTPAATTSTTSRTATAVTTTNCHDKESPLSSSYGSEKWGNERKASLHVPKYLLYDPEHSAANTAEESSFESEQQQQPSERTKELCIPNYLTYDLQDERSFVSKTTQPLSSYGSPKSTKTVDDDSSLLLDDNHHNHRRRCHNGSPPPPARQQRSSSTSRSTSYRHNNNNNNKKDGQPREKKQWEHKETQRTTFEPMLEKARATTALNTFANERSSNNNEDDDDSLVGMQQSSSNSAAAHDSATATTEDDAVFRAMRSLKDANDKYNKLHGIK